MSNARSLTCSVLRRLLAIAAPGDGVGQSIARNSGGEQIDNQNVIREFSRQAKSQSSERARWFRPTNRSSGFRTRRPRNRSLPAR